MTGNQEKHLEALQEQVRELIDQKFRKGAAEHGTDLMDASLPYVLDEAVDEVVDLLTYLLTMRLMVGSYRSEDPPNIDGKR